MTVSIQVTDFRGVVQDTYVVEEGFDAACLTAERLSRSLTVSTGRATFVGNIEVIG